MRLKKGLVIFLAIILSIFVFGCKTKKGSNIPKNDVTQQPSIEANNEKVTTEPTTSETVPNSMSPTVAPPTATPPIVHTHSWTTSKVVEPTCTSGGYTLMSCSCGETQKTNATSPLGHNLGPWETVTPATTTSTGLKKRACSRCGYTETEIIAKLISSPSPMIDEVFHLVNEQRAANGLSQLTYRSDLQQAADIRAGEIIDTFSHTRPDGTRCFTVFEEIGVKYYTHLGENIAIGYTTPESVMNGWMNSEGHRANILNPDFEGIIIGIREVNRNGYTGYSWVQLFITQ